MTPYFCSPEVTLFHGNSLEIMNDLPEGSFDVIFADPPYFLSNGGSTCKGGKRVSVDKGSWDRSQGLSAMHSFNHSWLSKCQRLLKPDGTIFVSGTHHVIFSVGFGLQELGFKILNQITWEKPNPPPNLGCRTFTHSTETIIWASKNKTSKHTFNYSSMKEDNGGTQMKDVWKITSPSSKEKVHGNHPTQKPLSLLLRILKASVPEGGKVLDPFNGSGTTGVASKTLGFHYTGIDLSSDYLDLTIKRINPL